MGLSVYLGPGDGKAQLQEHKLAGHIVSAVRKQLTGSEVPKL